MEDINQEDFKYEEEYISNSRGIKQFTCRWLPKLQKPKALIFLCHGYAMECSMFMRGTGTTLAKAGFAVYGIDYEGHGKSEGLQAYIPNFDNLVEDCLSYFTSICEKQENKKMKRFLLGESMGGAVAILLHRKAPNYWDGAVLVAPMCKIAEEMKPHPIVINILKKLTKIIPTWKVIPTKDIIDSAFKRPEKRDEVRNNPYCYKGNPRLKTGLELLRVSIDIEANLDKVSLPFIIVHGEEDTVTDPSASKLLHEQASTKDKTLNLYPKMWHGLIFGEPQENIHTVFSDIVEWLNQRLISGDDVGSGVLSEMELKSNNDEYSQETRPKEITADIIRFL